MSPSDVESLTTCPLRWFLRRHGAGGAPSGAQTMGVLLHSLAEQAQREGLRGQALMDALEARLPELDLPDTWLGSLEAQRARAMAQRLDAYLTGVPGQVEVERTVDATVHLTSQDQEHPERLAVRLRGRIDRLEVVEGTVPSGGDGAPLPRGHGQRVRLIDLKTGRTIPKDPERHPQLTAYRLALSALGYEVDGGALVLLGAEPRKKDDGVRLAPDRAALAPVPDPDTGEDWASQMLTDAALAARGPSLAATTGAHCQHCPVKDACPAVMEGSRTVI